MFHLPRTRKDKYMVATFWLGGLHFFYYEYGLVLPSYHDSWNGYVLFHIILGLFLAFKIYSNVLLIMSSDVTTQSIEVPEGDLPPGWKYCELCQKNAPPRCHHCKHCNKCILKRDHHCWFVGYCVGYTNQHHFIILLFYVCFVAIYANIYNWEFVLAAKGGMTWTTIPSFLAPHVGLLFGYYSLYEFYITAHTSIGIYFTIFFIWLLVVQIIVVCTGQVQYERKMKINDYALGFKHSFREIFGSAGLKMFLCPFLPTILPGDGCTFPEKNVKSKTD